VRSGDTLDIEIERGGARRPVTVVMRPFDRPFVELRELSDATPAQRELRRRWEAGAP
jgi:hypothetical protein